MKRKAKAVPSIGCVQHDCAACRMRSTAEERGFYRGVIAALGALKGMEAPHSVHYHEVARTFDVAALVREARREGDLEWSGIGEYVRYRRRVERESHREGGST